MNINEINKIVINYFSSNNHIKYILSKRRFLKIHNYEKRLFKRFLKNKKSKILDVCCGAGRVAISLAKEKHNVIGVDISPKLISIARLEAKKQNLPNVKFYCVDIENIKFRKKSFDYVLILENSLEYIPSNQKRMIIVKNIYSALKEGGLLIASFNSPFYYPSLFLRLFIQNTETFFLKFLNKNKSMDFNDIILKFDSPIYSHFFTFREIKKLFNRFYFIEIISINELNKGKNNLPHNIYPLIRPLLYTFWIFQKK